MVASPHGLTDEAANAAQWEIRNLLARVARMSDDGSIDDYMELFSEDVCWVIDGQETHGRAAMTDASSRRRAAGKTGPGSGTLHLVSTMSVDLVDDSHARAFSTFQFCRRRDGEVLMVLCGTYLDSLIRTADGWRIDQRRLRTL